MISNLRRTTYGWWFDDKEFDDAGSVAICGSGLLQWFNIPARSKKIQIRTTKNKLGANSIQARMAETPVFASRLHLLTLSGEWLETSVTGPERQLCRRLYGKEKFWVTIYHE